MSDESGRAAPTDLSRQLAFDAQQGAVQAILDARQQREADAYRDVYHYMLGYLSGEGSIERDRVVELMRTAFDLSMSARAETGMDG